MKLCWRANNGHFMAVLFHFCPVANSPVITTFFIQHIMVTKWIQCYRTMCAAPIVVCDKWLWYETIFSNHGNQEDVTFFPRFFLSKIKILLIFSAICECVCVYECSGNSEWKIEWTLNIDFKIATISHISPKMAAITVF